MGICLSAPIKSTGSDKSMHQTSSRLLRMTEDGRPFSRDLMNMFTALIVSMLPLSAHRAQLSKIEYTFLFKEAVSKLCSLKVCQSSQTPDPKDSSRIITITTTTTFSMSKDIATSMCHRFLEARFIESADGKHQQRCNKADSVLKLTPKGFTTLDRICRSHAIQREQVADWASVSSDQLLMLDRDSETDKLLQDRDTIEVIFRWFAATAGRNIRDRIAGADLASLHNYKNGYVGVKIAAERKINGITYKSTFTGKFTADWLMGHSTVMDRYETIEIASLFIAHGLMESLVQDQATTSQITAYKTFRPIDDAIYTLTKRGEKLISGFSSGDRSSHFGNSTASQRSNITRGATIHTLETILNNPACRLLFRENLREMHCEENLCFYEDVEEFVRNCEAAICQAQKSPNTSSTDNLQELVVQAYDIYHVFLAPGSPCELNLEHQLRHRLATHMIKVVHQDINIMKLLQEVMSLMRDVQGAIFRLMATDSTPKFLRNAKYELQLCNYDPNMSACLSEPSRSPGHPSRKL